MWREIRGWQRRSRPRLRHWFPLVSIDHIPTLLALFHLIHGQNPRERDEDQAQRAGKNRAETKAICKEKSKKGTRRVSYFTCGGQRGFCAASLRNSRRDYRRISIRPRLGNVEALRTQRIRDHENPIPKLTRYDPFRFSVFGFCFNSTCELEFRSKLPNTIFQFFFLFW